jgi:hypothetical protein
MSSCSRTSGPEPARSSAQASALARSRNTALISIFLSTTTSPSLIMRFRRRPMIND